MTGQQPFNGGRGPADPPAPARVGLSEWLDRGARHVFIMPAVVMILIFSICPLIASFVIVLAALESVPRDLVEAGHVDGAAEWQIFREITWPQIMPVAATVMLIRVIEAFKLVDLPNIMTAGGPGIATESMTLHAFFAWRAPDLGQSAATSYLLLFVTVVLCASFFNLVVLRHKAAQA